MMPNSINKIWIHSIWATHKKTSLILPEIEDRIYKYLQVEFIACGCTVKAINGMPDHVHALFQMNPKRALDEIIKMVKGCTSNTINLDALITEKFAWHKGYSAYSVSESQLEFVYQNIKNQKTLHAKNLFPEGFDEII